MHRQSPSKASSHLSSCGAMGWKLPHASGDLSAFPEVGRDQEQFCPCVFGSEQFSISGANPGRWRKENPRGKIFPNPLASPRSWPLSCPETEKSLSPLWLQGWHPSARIHGPSGPSCAAASLRFYGNTPLSSHWDIIFFLPIFNNLQLKGSCKGMELVTAYFQHRFVLLLDFPALHTAQLLSQALAAAASPAWPCLLHPQRGGNAPAGHKLGFPLSYFIAWAHCRSFPHWLHAGFHLWLHQPHTAGFPQPGNL